MCCQRAAVRAAEQLGLTRSLGPENTHGMETIEPSPLSDLLVVLGTSRFGADWPNVCAAVCGALGPLDKAPKPLTPDECAERYRSLVEGKPGELSDLASRLQAERLAQLTKRRSEIVARITTLCQDLPEGHPARPAAAFGPPGGGASGDDGGSDGQASKRARGGGLSLGDPGYKYENELDDHWHAIAEEEERNARRATVAGTLGKMLNVVQKHKWAYPFRRPVTEREAPDYKCARARAANARAPRLMSYLPSHDRSGPMTVAGSLGASPRVRRGSAPLFPLSRENPDWLVARRSSHLVEHRRDVIANPMDFTTLKRRIEQGAVGDMDAFMADLNLIFDNAMKYNGEGTDFYHWANTLKRAAAAQHENYVRWRAKAGGNLGAKTEAPPGEAGASNAPPPADADGGRRAGRRAAARK